MKTKQKIIFVLSIPFMILSLIIKLIFDIIFFPNLLYNFIDNELNCTNFYYKHFYNKDIWFLTFFIVNLIWIGFLVFLFTKYLLIPIIFPY